MRTPLLESERLNRVAGRRILLKPECLQRGGAFKFRGAWNHIRSVYDQLQGRSVVAVSSGNHGGGVARAAQLLGVSAAIVMPYDAPRPKAEAVRTYGAEIIGHDRGVESRNEVAEGVIKERNAHFVPPFDDPLVMAGQGTIGLEIAADAHRVGVTEAEVLVPCSGGGLASGVAIALESESPKMQVRPVEPEHFDPWTRSLAAGQLLANKKIPNSICDALQAEAPGEIPWEAAQGRFGAGIVISDEQALHAVAMAWKWFHIVLEPSGAVSLAAALRQEGEAAVIVVASGGNMEADMYARALAEFSDKDPLAYRS